jgi:hypothetical protein
MMPAGWRSATVVAWCGALLVVGALLLYGFTLDNGLQPEELVGGDLITHQYAQVQARPSNAPGYPLYTMGGWLWFHVGRAFIRALGQPLPNPIVILSSYSMLWALLALWLFYRLLCQITRTPSWPHGHWPLAGLLTGFYAVTYFFWYYATTTEQYSSAIAQTLAIVYVYFLWRDELNGGRGTSTAERNRRATYYIFLLALLCGLALAHMLTIAFIVPPLVLVMIWEAPELRRRWKVIGGAVVAACLPLISYLYVYQRGATHPEWWGDGPWQNVQQWFWVFVSTAQGREELGWGFEPGRAFFGNQFPELIWHELSLPLLLLGLIGIALLGRKPATLLYGTLAIYLVFCWAYRYGNWYQVILPAYPLLLLGVAALASSGIDYAERAGWRSAWRLLPYGLLTVALVWRFNASLPAANSRNRTEDTALDQAATLIEQRLPQGARLFAEVQDALALDYLINIWQIRPDLQVVSSPQAADALRAEQPLLSTWSAATTLRNELPGDLQTNLQLQSAAADWIRFSPGPVELMTPLILSKTPVTDTLILFGYSTAIAPVSRILDADPPSALDITLYWQLSADWPSEVAISVRPTAEGHYLPDPAIQGAILQQDRARPAHGLLAVHGDALEQPVADAYRFIGASEADGVQVILYRQHEGGFENLAELDLPIP